MLYTSTDMNAVGSGPQVHQQQQQPCIQHHHQSPQSHHQTHLPASNNHQQQQQHHHNHHHHQQQQQQQHHLHHQQQQHQLQHTHQQQHQHLHQFGSHHTIDSTTLTSTPHGHSKKSVDKGSEEYKKRRERNNVAVRKSREKAKMRSRETERRVAELSKENQLYRAQYEELRREFNVLKSLLLKTGLTEQVIEDEAQRHTMQQQLNQQVSQSDHQHLVVTGNHHIVGPLNASAQPHVGSLKGVNCNSVVSSNTNSQTQNSHHHHYAGTTIDHTVDQWTDGISTYVEEYASF